ncbi:Basic-leucine zipper domain-containing protein [Artemisia annua]|uniref:Basic-leucine zipper domain-containing protein n=1 Tax=Artemisia annua TaxID=35608 RepID=A0A2U1LHK5_ARTAN|nr:Basic-leucine zipper domain-containing protein [Artemisia annua]
MKNGIRAIITAFLAVFQAPMLASGMCTDVFQFDVSAAAASGAIVPATSVGNITAGNGHNSSYITTVKNRRVLYGLPTPLSGSNTNITKEQAGDTAGVEGMMGGKSFSRIFVVVLLDSVNLFIFLVLPVYFVQRSYVAFCCKLTFHIGLARDPNGLDLNLLGVLSRFINLFHCPISPQQSVFLSKSNTEIFLPHSNLFFLTISVLKSSVLEKPFNGLSKSTTKVSCFELLAFSHEKANTCYLPTMSLYRTFNCSKDEVNDGCFIKQSYKFIHMKQHL